MDGGFVGSTNSLSTSADTNLKLGGMQGTTLEDVFHKNIKTPLWSATLTETDPETVIAAHLAFLEAGSLIIMTST